MCEQKVNCKAQKKKKSPTYYSKITSWFQQKIHNFLFEPPEKLKAVGVCQLHFLKFRQAAFREWITGSEETLEMKLIKLPNKQTHLS